MQERAYHAHATPSSCKPLIAGSSACPHHSASCSGRRTDDGSSPIHNTGAEGDLNVRAPIDFAGRGAFAKPVGVTVPPSVHGSETLSFRQSPTNPRRKRPSATRGTARAYAGGSPGDGCSGVALGAAKHVRLTQALTSDVVSASGHVIILPDGRATLLGRPSAHQVRQRPRGETLPADDGRTDAGGGRCGPRPASRAPPGAGGACRAVRDGDDAAVAERSVATRAGPDRVMDGIAAGDAGRQDVVAPCLEHQPSPVARYPLHGPSCWRLRTVTQPDGLDMGDG